MRKSYVTSLGYKAKEEILKILISSSKKFPNVYFGPTFIADQFPRGPYGIEPLNKIRSILDELVKEEKAESILVARKEIGGGYTFASFYRAKSEKLSCEGS